MTLGEMIGCEYSSIDWEISDDIIQSQLSKINPNVELILENLQDLIEFHLKEYSAASHYVSSSFDNSEIQSYPSCNHPNYPKENFIPSMRYAEDYLDDVTCSGNYVTDHSLCWLCNMAIKFWDDGFAKFNIPQKL